MHLSFIVCFSSHECWHSSFHVCGCCCPQNKVAAQGVTRAVFCPSFVPQVCLLWQKWGCAAKPAGRGCELAWWDINWNADTEPLLLSLLRVIGVVILGGGVLPSSWSGRKGERQRTVILETDSCLLRGQILTDRDEQKPKFFVLALWLVRVPMITKGYLLCICLLCICLLWCCCFASVNPTLWPV